MESLDKATIAKLKILLDRYNIPMSIKTPVKKQTRVRLSPFQTRLCAQYRARSYSQLLVRIFPFHLKMTNISVVPFKAEREYSDENAANNKPTSASYVGRSRVKLPTRGRRLFLNVLRLAAHFRTKLPNTLEKLRKTL